jgi:hypothetical protein
MIRTKHQSRKKLAFVFSPFLPRTARNKAADGTDCTDANRSVIAMYGVFGFTLGNGLRIVGCVAAGYALQGRIRESTPEFPNSTKARH